MSGRPPTWKLVVAFAAIYLIWGSTYLGIRFAIETLPAFLMAGTRFLVAGLLLFLLARSQGAPRPTRANWRGTAVVGAFLLLGGNGGVTWAEQHVPSGLAALLVAIVPLWVVLLNWIRPGGSRPSLAVMAGVMIGLVGIALLVGPGDTANEPVNPLGVIALMISTFCWASGSLYARSAPLPESSLLSTSMQMLVGGLLLTLVGTLTGEWGRFDLALVSPRSLLALVYLIVFGAIMGYTAYSWLLKVTSPARAATYAYVNPVVAVILGWALADEPLTLRTLVAAGIIIGAVVLITVYRDRQSGEVRSGRVSGVRLFGDRLKTVTLNKWAAVSREGR